MKVKDLKPCLYFSISDENFKKLREIDEDCHITKNDFFLYTAVKYKDVWFMTSSASTISYKSYKNLNTFIRIIKEYQSCFYIQDSAIEITDEVLDLFDFEFDLEECKVVDYPEDYNFKDLIFARLTIDTTVKEPLILIDKNIKKTPIKKQERILSNLSEEIKPPRYNKEEAEKILDRAKKENLEIYNELKIYIKKVKELEEDLKRMNFKHINPRTGKAKLIKEI